jgi:hypothetical protein
MGYAQQRIKIKTKPNQTELEAPPLSAAVGGEAKQQNISSFTAPHLLQPNIS